jgi:hypothetical protein
MKYPPITYALLKDNNACAEELKIFKKHFGTKKPIPLTKKTINKFAYIFTVTWAASYLLDAEDYDQYCSAVMQLRTAYTNKRDAARTKCKNLWTEKYFKESDKLRNQFLKDRATIFVDIYKKA